MSAGSVSKQELVLTLKGKTSLNLELKRHLAPKTVGTIMRSIPIEGNAHMIGISIAFVDTTIRAGGEKLRTQFKKGDVGFLASNSSICFFMDDISSTKSMTLIGKVTSNIESLKDVKPGDIFTITQAGT
ncbi:MAG: cyclophilin-like family protein [Candidatus Nitrosotalea sp.]|nr:cyclophilin-like family protein [Candidatus Nitrosotalea sp.]